MFVSFEGVDGSGKTTQVELLREHLVREGREVVATREPGGTPLGEQVREILLLGDGMAPWTEAALFTAARAELVERVIAPALDRGADVVCDRYLDSSLAYQGIARGLGVERVLEMNLPAVRGLLPDRSFFLFLDPADAKARSGSDPDRIESEDDDFRRRVDAAYRKLARTFPDRVVAVDAARDPQLIARTIREHLREPS